MQRRPLALTRWAAVCCVPIIGLPIHAALAVEPVLQQVASGIPAEFADLTESHRAVVDAFFGDRKIGQFEIETGVGTLRLLDPAALAAAIPGLLDRKAVEAALTGPSAANARYICNVPQTDCDRPRPAIAAMVFDPAHYRVDIFVNPEQLEIKRNATAQFLSSDQSSLSLVDTFSFAVAGGSGQDLIYSIRDRIVMGSGPARLIADGSISTTQGLDIDTLGFQLDRPNTRLAAGLFYAPGADLIGRRRMLGIGVSSQFDTRLDRSELMGSPIIVFLDQRSRVDVYVEGRIVSSRTLESGNQQLDTTGLPDGSYQIELRIQSATGATRSEQRFFTKSAALAPAGQLVYHAEAGLIALTRDKRPFALSRLPLITTGVAGRYGAHFAWDAALMATDQKAVAELGISIITPIAHARIAILSSSTGDRGTTFQVNSPGSGRLGYSFDLRHLRNPDGRSLVPIDAVDLDTLGLSNVSGRRIVAPGADYTQLIGNISYNVAGAQVAATGYYARTRDGRTSFALGPVVRRSIIHRDRLQLSVSGSYAQTDRGPSSFLGLQLQVLQAHAAFRTAVGVQSSNRPNRSLGEFTELGASIQKTNVLGGDLNGTATLQHGGDGTVMQASVDERGSPGYLSASLVQQLRGGTSGTQYGLAGQTTLALGAGAVSVGAREQTDSVITVEVESSSSRARFEVVVDDAVRGVIRANQRIVLAVPPYRRYNVRVRAIGTELLSLDTGTSGVDILPGSFARLRWAARPVVAMFGRLIDQSGVAVADADISTVGAIAATDSRGYFQLQAAADSILMVRSANGATCTAMLNTRPSSEAYIPLGDITCRD